MIEFEIENSEVELDEFSGSLIFNEAMIFTNSEDEPVFIGEQFEEFRSFEEL